MRQSWVLKVGLGQINPTVGDFKENTRKICSYIESAERQELDLVIFPELAICGYPVWDLAHKVSFVKANLKSLAEIAAVTKRKHVTAVVGFIDLAGSGSPKNYNALAVIRNGKIIHKQYKTLLPTYDVFLEEIFFLPAKNHSVFSMKNTRFGATICEDIWDDQYAVKPAKILAQKGARILINISASPYHKETLLRRNETILRKAKEYGLWVVYVNQVGGQDDLIFDGRSFVCDPKGRIHFRADAFREGLFKFTFDLDSKHPPVIPAYAGIRRPLDSRFSAKVRGGLVRTDFAVLFGERGNDIIVIKDMYEALLTGLSDYIRKNRFRKVIVGLSGGIDSALVATIARDALGPQSVIGVAMPGPYSSKHSLKDAKTLAQNLGIEFRVKPIRALYQRFIHEAAGEKRKRGVRPMEHRTITVAMENLQARLRGLELMYLSNDEGAVLLTTGNKSELAMGYSTLYGDMCGGLSVIGDVYKTDVYRMARYRNTISQVIPESTFKKPPSAELRPHQKDQDSLPPYRILDQILFHYIEKNQSLPEMVKSLASKGISERTIRWVTQKVDANEYKRRQLPPALRITEKAWFGRRMPITNRFEK